MVAAPIDSNIVYYLLIGGASIPYVNAPEVAFSPAKIHSPPRGSPPTQMRSSPSCYPESPTTRPGRTGKRLR